MWTTGKIEGYDFQVKHFEEGSQFGIEGGRISKLAINRNGVLLVNYDRGWDIKRMDSATKRVYNIILDRYN